MPQEPPSKDLCPLKIETCPIGQELEKLRAECERLREQAQVDALTGLFNYRFLLSSLEKEMERTRRSGIDTSLIMIDLDEFKGVNDTYGHETGNRALVWCSRIWGRTVRRIDIPCRYGGEEFAIILPGSRLPQACRAAERLRKALDDSTLETDGHAIHLTASFGVDSYRRGDEISALAFIEQTDRYLLKSKTEGRNRVSCNEALISESPTEITDREREVLYLSRRPDA